MYMMLYHIYIYIYISTVFVSGELLVSKSQEDRPGPSGYQPLNPTPIIKSKPAGLGTSSNNACAS